MREQLKIFRSIIKLISVDVVNMLPFFKLPTDNSLHYCSMFPDGFARYGNSSVSLLVNPSLTEEFISMVLAFPVISSKAMAFLWDVARVSFRNRVAAQRSIITFCELLFAIHTNNLACAGTFVKE